jgi:hypothetical protein
MASLHPFSGYLILKMPAKTKFPSKMLAASRGSGGGRSLSRASFCPTRIP